MLCPGCLEGELIDAPLNDSETNLPHVVCKSCHAVFVKHPECRSMTYRGLHPCDSPRQHIRAA